MTIPPSYVPFQDYGTYQANHQLPGPALQGTDLNTEFARLKATTDALINNIGLIQRSDGALNNQSVTPDTISSSLAILIAGWNIRGAWVTSTSYVLKDYVTNGGNGYVCIVANTSGVFATDLAAGKWSLVSTQGNQGIQGLQGLQGVAGPAGPIAPTFRNRLINGDFRVDQRGNGATIAVAAGGTNVYTVDRWYAACTDGGAVGITVQRVAGTGSNQNAARLTTASTQNLTTVFGQRIESSNCYDFANQNVVASLMLSASAITTVTWAAYRPNATDNWSARTQIATGTLTISPTPTAYNFTFNAGGGVIAGLEIEFTTGSLSNGGTIQYENIQAEAGTSPTAFEKRHFTAELAMCQRYCLVKRATAANQLGIVGMGHTTNTQQDFFDKFPVEMFKTPSFAVSAATDFTLAAVGGATGGVTFNSGDKWGAWITTANAGVAANAACALISGGVGFMKYDAEL